MAEKKKSSKHVEVDATIDRDEMALALSKELNKLNKDGSKSSFFLDEEDDPSLVSDWLSTGSTLLDLAISNRKNGGMPAGKFIELSGLEGTGKSLLCAQMIAETQKQNGLAVFFDSEFAVDKTFWTALGINVKNVNYVPFVTLEELFSKMEACIGAFRKFSKDRLLTIFVDSLTQASSESEMESEHGVSGYNTGKAIVLSKAMRKITGLIARQRILAVFTNQLRYNMSATNPNSEKWITPGGKAFPYACSVRVRFANLGKLKKGDEVIGMKCQAQVIKNRMGPNWKTAQFEIHYDSGIQNYKSWIDFMKLHGIITGDWRGWKFTKKDGTKVEFSTSEFVNLMGTDAELKSEVYDQICDKYIMQYHNPDTKAIVEDVEETGDENDDISKNAVKDE